MPLVLDGTNGVSGVDGTASNPAIEGTDSNTGIFYPAADTVAIGTGGTEALRIDSARNMGLGVTPNTWFSGYKVIETGSGSLVFPASATNTQLWNNLYVNAAGNTIYKSTGIGGLYSLGGGGNAHVWYSAPSGTAGTTATLTQAMTLDASGNLGVGITSPVSLGSNIATIDIGASSGGGIRFRTSGAGNSGYLLANASGVDLGTNDSVYLRFVTAANERARIASGGNLLVNATAAIVNSNEAIGAVALNSTSPAISGKNSAGATSACLESWNSATSGNNLFIMFSTETAYTTRGNIDYNRGAGQVRYNTTSDATLKNIIGDSDGQKSVEILNSTRIREYAWKDDEQQKPQIGVIAQELYETYKGAVSVGGEVEKTDEEGNVTTEYRPWGVDKTAFTFHLIAGWQAHEKIIKEQQAMIDELNAKVAALENA